MNLYAYLRVGPHGRIYIPSEFNKHVGLSDGPAFIEAKLCDDGYIELGPVIPGSKPPRVVSEMLPGLVVPEPFDDPRAANESAARGYGCDLWDETAYLLRSPENARRLMEAIVEDKARDGGSAHDSAMSETSMPAGWTVTVEDGCVRVGLPSWRPAEGWFGPDEARGLGLALRVASSEAASTESGASKSTGIELGTDE